MRRSLHRLYPHGLIGGSESFQIKSPVIRNVLFWSVLFVLVGITLSAIWIASNADNCDYETATVGTMCRITKDGFGNAQIINIIFIAVVCLVLLMHVRNIWKLSGNMLRAGAITGNERHSMLIAGMSLLTLILAATNLTIGYFFLYKTDDSFNKACKANTGANGASILAWILLIYTIIMAFVTVLGIGGYGKTALASGESHKIV